MRPEYLSEKLTAPILTKDRGTLRTIQEGCEYMAAISKERAQRRHWQQVPYKLREGARTHHSSGSSPVWAEGAVISAACGAN
jgi:hypothetical protein